MKIESNGVYNPQPSKPQPGQDVAARPTSQAKPGVQADQVSLSPAAQAMQINREAPVDQDRINAIRQAIASGQYQVNAEGLASKLMAYARIANER